MAYFEGPECGFVSPDVFWWFFIVTGTTVGYGDFSPVTLGGRVTAAIIMMGGIGIFAAIVAKITERTIQFTQRRNKGMINLHMKGHVVIFGYRGKETSQLVRELSADSEGGSVKIVLCSENTTENPLSGEAEFVSGELTSDDVLERACVNDARGVIIYGRDDAQTLAVGIAVNNAMKNGAHIVAYFAQSENAIHLKRVNSKIECVTALSVPLLVQAVQDPGSTESIGILVSNLDTQCTQYRLNLPTTMGRVFYGELMIALKKRFNATIIGVARSHDHNAQVCLNLDDSVQVIGGMSVFYIAKSRLSVDQVVSLVNGA
ncbi:MAG: ion channel [Candidatus Pacebacteria bacterium]|nr:ion channel [Candidatus Paceibacterota bacterium]